MDISFDIVTNYSLHMKDSFQESLPEDLRNTIERIHMVCCALLCLLSPVPVPDATPTQVSNITEYKGDNAMLTLVKKELSKTRWQKKWDEVLGKYIATRDLMPQIMDIQKKLDVRPVNRDDVAKACGERVAFRKAVRAGALSKFEFSLQNALHTLSEELVESDAAGSTMGFLQSIKAGMDLFTDPKSFQCSSQLVKLMGRASEQLLEAELLSILEKYPEIGAEPLALEDRYHLDPLAGAIESCKKVKLSQKVLDKFPKAVYWHMRALFIQMRVSCLLQAALHPTCASH